MSIHVFLSHTSKDKEFTRRISSDLQAHGMRCWINEAEIKAGESLIEKIRKGIDDADYVIAILSPNSINSPWVQREIDVAMNQEIAGRQIKVIPIIYIKCELPGFLLGKLYVDFTDQADYQSNLKKLVESLGFVYNPKILSRSTDGERLADQMEPIMAAGLRIFPRPFYRPHQYPGMSIAQAETLTEHTRNDFGNIVIETADCRMLLEAEGNFVSYVDIEFKKTGPCNQKQEFDPEPLLGALGINLYELEAVRTATHSHTYYDHKRKLQINAICQYDEAPFSVGISSRYYGS